MEKEQRNALRATIVKARRLLDKDFQEQLEGTYNILADGRVLENARGDPIVRARLLDVFQHHRAGGATAPEAVDRVVREAAFTVLNRFAALKMAERRLLVRECVSQGIQSEGIRELAECAPGLRGALEDDGYRLLLDAVMDEISLDLKVLFDRRDSMAPLWPGPKALDDLLETLNDPHLADVWAEDEAIGWVYQYFNDNDVKEMRETAKGGAPRNSRELAVRNQFFTPRYVVEFLTENTLGRLWYEMTRGETVLRERCRYLVRRPTEIFLKPGEPAPKRAAGSEASAGENLSQEDLLRQPVHIPHRPLKDPREIRLLDPACGSMHFGLYAFDLFTVIYDEAWEIAHGPDDAATETLAPFVAFAVTFPDKAAFLREVPRLILERNLHGIDIDPRAAQIAGLSLWMRAQRSWHQAGVKPVDRPRITRSNLVCAEPMPGEKELLHEFIEQQFPVGERPAFAFLLEKIFDRMTLAGEAGSPLRIEEEIRTAIADAKRLWKQSPKAEQALLFPESGEEHSQGELPLDLSGITDEQFWERAEQRIYDALEAYAEQAENGGGFRRRLFADDAAQGFAFIDLCRKRYDVVVMNPPFGLVAEGAKAYLQSLYPEDWNDYYNIFIRRASELLMPSGSVGAVVPNRLLYAKKSRSIREHLSSSWVINALVDAGRDVMDAAAVDAMFFVAAHQGSQSKALCPTLNLTEVDPEKRANLLGNWCSEPSGIIDFRQFRNIPSTPFAYAAPVRYLELWSHGVHLDPDIAVVATGGKTFNDYRFLRVRWEIAAATISRVWASVDTGGDYQLWISPSPFVQSWANDGSEIRAFAVSRRGTDAQVMQSSKLWWKPGLTYPLTSSIGFGPRIFPAGTILSADSIAIHPKVESHSLSLLGILASNWASELLACFGDHRRKENSIVKSLPIRLTASLAAKMPTIVFRAVNAVLGLERARETSAYFVRPGSGALVAETARILKACIDDATELALSAFGLSQPAVPAHDNSALIGTFAATPSGSEVAGETLSYAIGSVFGRWDIRYATGERPAPELPDPFAPLPVCPPGMLQGDDGLPLSPEEAGRRLGRYPLDVAWDGILVDDPEHPLDLGRRVHAVLAVLWGDRANALEHEACALLGVPALREWFRRPVGFFADHLKRYSKSRRQAPIYWPLSTVSGSYTIWLYYHRITADTLFQLVAEYLEPKLRKTREERLHIEAGQAKAEGRESAKLGRQAGELIALEQELEEMKAELLRVAELPYKPDLNDGVQLTAAPLWRLFRLPKWRKDLEVTWKEFEKGEYDWAHLAYAMWPDRVRQKCKTDRSLAIAHGLEGLCEVEVAPKKKRRKMSDA